ncbi:hypothetical protein G7054_g1809 [Neopestalotiopsis clavispora]|nr:hypothetical protein G7054_g1809 [Neopestalotiopsis clavispora]
MTHRHFVSICAATSGIFEHHINAHASLRGAGAPQGSFFSSFSPADFSRAFNGAKGADQNSENPTLSPAPGLHIAAGGVVPPCADFSCDTREDTPTY